MHQLRWPSGYPYNAELRSHDLAQLCMSSAVGLSHMMVSQSLYLHLVIHNEYITEVGPMKIEKYQEIMSWMRHLLISLHALVVQEPSIGIQIRPPLNEINVDKETTKSSKSRHCRT